MANWLKPAITDIYTQVLDWLKARDTDLAKGLDPAAVTVDNPEAGFIRYASAARRWEKFNGTSWAPLASSYAINADTASKWQTPRTVTLAGGATGSVALDGSANITLTAAIVQGPGSGLNADLLDGQHGGYYADIAARLGYTPVQQGTGIGQTSNTVKIGWSAGSKLKATVDSTDFGAIALESWVSTYFATAIAGKANDSGTYSGLNVGYATSAGNADTVDGWHRDDIRAWGNLTGKPAGADIPFNWSGQAGQPAWVWGGNDGSNAYVWNPANFSVAYAASAGSANTINGYPAAQLWRTDQEAHSFTSTGYQKLPSGLIMQWGTHSHVGGTGEIVAFPIPFPTACLNITTSNADGLGGNLNIQAYNLTTTNFTAKNNNAGAVKSAWLAIGY